MAPARVAALSFTRHGRSRQAGLALVAIYAGLWFLSRQFDASGWIIGGLAVCTLPALVDFLRNSRAGLTLDDHHLAWYSGRRRAGLDLDEIDHMEFDTRWDFSVRVTAVLKEHAKKIRLPAETLPPHTQLEQAFKARQIRVIRHKFTTF